MSLFLTEGWYDPSKRDATGHLCSNLELLVLGVLFRLGNGSCSRWAIQTGTNIDKEVHRRFFQLFTSKIAGIQGRYISLPKDEVSLRYVTRDYAALGLPGCCGSIDVVHIGWDACPANLLHLFKGKESYPSIAYEVIVNQRREIMSVTNGHPGARNDKHICRLDDQLLSLSNGDGWLSEKEWWAFGEDDKTLVEKGLYLICDGGYLRWPTLICPIKVSERFLQLSKVIEGARKDVEDVFGMLKKRFLYLKHWNTTRTQSVIDNAFVTCCVLHNMQLRSDGYLDDNLVASSFSSMRPFRSQNRGDSIWRRDWEEYRLPGHVSRRTCGATNEKKWRERMKVLLVHFLQHMALKKTEDERAAARRAAIIEAARPRPS